MSATDYRTLYEQYWSRPDRWGSHSFDDVGALSEQVLAVCGPGRMLDVGCGMGLLVRTLLSRGVDAVGADVSARCARAGNAVAPGRFVEASVLALPFGDGAFETVVSTDLLEHLAEEDVGRALRELARVARRNVFVRVATAPDRDGTWHLTVRAREWWEARFLEAGLRKHPGLVRVLPYDSIEREGTQATLAFEHLPAGALEAHPAESLAAGRDLHMDMLREAGRRSDAHVARYAYAAQFVRPGDTVLDAACGLGYGSAVLARNSGAARVVGVDADAAGVEYAAACYGAEPSPPGVVEFRAGTLPDLSFLADRSVDLVACFETLEHVPDPAALLKEFSRVLTPGGRVVVSVPNEWTDETGRDPNPHHLHVYTWERLGRELAGEFLVERCAAQTAGGGMKLAERGRRIAECAFASDTDASPELKDPPEAEWWLAVAMKSPVGCTREGYRESAYPVRADAAFNLTAFARDYDNPWLVRSLVSIGMRATRAGLVRHLVDEMLKGARAGSADEGAALCVGAYQELERAGVGDPARFDEIERRIGAFVRGAEATAHARRWAISNQYAAGLMALARGRRDEGRRSFEACAGMDCAVFSPLLASKTVDAAFRAGAMAAGDGDASGAREWWTRGVREARRALSSDWLNVVGEESSPLVFGLPEAAVVADLASRCAFGLDLLGRRPASSAQVWGAAHTQTFADARRWAAALADSKAWLEEELERQRGRGRELAGTLEELRAWNARQDEGRAWLEKQREALAEAVAQRERAFEAMRKELSAAGEARAWAVGQAESWQAAAEEHARSVAELREWNARLIEARDWLQSQVAARDGELAKLRGWAEELTRGRDWLEEQRRGLIESLAARDAAIAGLRGAEERLRSEVAGLREQVARREAEVAELNELAGELRERVDQLDRRVSVRVRAIAAAAEGAGNNGPAALEQGHGAGGAAGASNGAAGGVHAGNGGAAGAEREGRREAE